MKRILEPEVMDTIEDAKAYDAMDFLEVNTAFVDRLIDLGVADGHFLDLGTGTARIPIILAKRVPNIQITAIDLSSNMLNIGQEHVNKAKLTDRISLEKADAKNLPYKDQSFDGVFSNSIIHHIPNPSSVILEIERVLKPQGLLYIQDLLRLESTMAIEKIVDTYAREDTPYQRKLFLDSLFAALTTDEVETMISKTGVTNAKVFQTSDRHWSIERGFQNLSIC